MMLISPDLYNGYQQQQQQQTPETRLEDGIVGLLEREQLPDDAKAKLLGHLITRFQKVTHEPPEPVRVSVVNNAVESESEPSVGEQQEDDHIVRDIVQSVPRSHAKFVPLILEKLKTRLYGWNEYGEFVVNKVPLKKSKIVDLFSYMMRNQKRAEEPLYFNRFWSAIREINIPMSWIANQKLTQQAVESPRDNPVFSTPSRKKKKKKKTSRARTSTSFEGSDSEGQDGGKWKMKKWVLY